jgi:CBS domain-containing protein
MIRQLTLNFNDDRLVEAVLKLAKEGATKKTIMERFGMSRPQVRRFTAELVNKDLLSYHTTLKSFMTTARGNIYLSKVNSKRSSSKLFKAIDASKEIIMLDSNKTLWDARNQMLKYNINRIVVSSDDRAVGVVTEKDIARFLYNAPTRALNEIALKEFTNKKLFTVGEQSDINYCANLMLQHHISSLLVVDDQMKAKGIITKTDIIEFFAHHQANRSPVHKFMSKKVHTVAPDESLHMIAMLMSTYKISRVVVEKNRKPVGIVTSRDFLPFSLVYGTGPYGRYWGTRSNGISGRTRHKFIPAGILGMTLAQDIMTPSPLTIDMNANIGDAAKVMLRNGISGLPVVNGKGDLVGIVTKTDITRVKIKYSPGLQ